MPEFRFDKQNNVDETLVQVVMYEDEQVAGTVILTPNGWKEFKEKVYRTKVKCEG